MKDFQIRVMEENDLSAAMDIKNEEGWNQTLADWRFLLHDKPRMCLVALHQNKVIATVSAIGYENKLAWVGMMLVRKEYRGMGLAKTLMVRILDTLKDYESIKLDATPAGFPVYAKLGFVSEFNIHRMVRPPKNGEDSKKNRSKIQASKPASLKEIVDFDEQIYGVNRQNMLQHLYGQSTENVKTIKNRGAVKGYLMDRAGTNHRQLGPLIAESTEAAMALLTEAFINLADCSVVIDVLENKKDLIAWLHTKGFVQQRELIRMYYQNNPYPGIITRQYLISGPELG